MANVPEGLIRPNDIRGVYGQELTDEVAYLLGKSFGTFFRQNNQIKVSLGRDNRLSGETIAKQIIKGLVETGCEVTDFGLSLSPLIYFSWYGYDFNASIMITASHNPAKYNGFKCSLNKVPFSEQDLKKIKEIYEKESFVFGKGSQTVSDVWPDYEKYVCQSIKLAKKLKVVIDCGNGTAGLFAPKLLEKLGCEVLTVFCESDGSFPNHQPYPQKFELYTKLVETIKENKADIGLSFDGDGDRLGVFDEKGNYIVGDYLSMLFVQDILAKSANKKICMNVTTTLSLIDFIRSLGGEFFFTKTGYPFVTAKMKEVEAIWGGEISGHFFFKDRFLGFDDALYAGVRILEILSQSNQALSQMTQNLPHYLETREFRLELPNGLDKFETVDKIKQKIITDYPQAEMLDIDGLRFSLGDAWGLIRASLTEPLITGRAEGKNETDLNQIKTIIKNNLQAFGIALDWSQYQ